MNSSAYIYSSQFTTQYFFTLNSGSEGKEVLFVILLMYNEIARSDGSLSSKPTEAGWVSGGGKALDQGGGLDLEPRR